MVAEHAVECGFVNEEKVQKAIANLGVDVGAVEVMLVGGWLVSDVGSRD